MEWKEVRLGDVCDLIAGFAFKAKDFGEFPTKVIKIGDIKPPFVDYVGQVGVDISNYDINRLSKYTVKYGDYVLAMTGATIGKVGKYISENFSYINQRVLKFSPKQNVDADFINYIICSNIFAKYVVNFVDSESAQPNISAPTISKFAFQIPSEKDDQHRIASILSSLDRKIELNNKINTDLEEMAQAIFKNWFVDFEPFKDGKFVDSELGMIPEGWKVGRADDFYQINIGKTPPRKEHKWFSNNPADKIWVSIANMGNSGIFISDSSEYLTKEAVDRHNIIMVPRNTILLSFKLTVGRVAIADKELTTNEAIARFILSDDKYMEYLYLYLKKYDYNSLGSTSSIATAVNSKTIKGMQMLQPSDKIIDAFHIQVNPIFEKIRSLTKENSRLSLLRDTLLPRLMSGEIEVPD